LRKTEPFLIPLPRLRGGSVNAEAWTICCPILRSSWIPPPPAVGRANTLQKAWKSMKLL
jgi:hypothetical protein